MRNMNKEAVTATTKMDWADDAQNALARVFIQSLSIDLYSRMLSTNSSNYTLMKSAFIGT